MEKNRRIFLRKSLIAAAGTAVSMGTILKVDAIGASKKLNKARSPLSEKSLHFMKMIGIKYPIIQAPTGGVVKPSMTIAVADEGVLGAIPLTWTSPESSFEYIQTIKKSTKGKFFANFLLQFEPKSLDKTLEAGVHIVQFSWGIPSQAIIKKLRESNVIMGIQVTSEASAVAAIEAGADYLVCQGTEAGGHVHASRPLADALVRVLNVAGDVPVAASGGIATGKDMRKYLEMGASAVVMGTRFVASKECSAHQEYKNSLVKAKSEDTVFTVCLNKSWPNATHRILRNNTFEMWEAAGCPPLEKSPGVDDIVAHYANGHELSRYSSGTPVVGMIGNVKDAAMYAGKGVDNITDIPSVSDIIERIWNEYLYS